MVGTPVGLAGLQLLALAAFTPWLGILSPTRARA